MVISVKVLETSPTELQTLPDIVYNLRILLKELANVQQVVLPDMPENTTGLALLESAQNSGLDTSTVQHAVAELLGIPFLDDLLDYPTSPTFTDRVPISFARQFCLVGIEKNASDNVNQAANITVALSDISNLNKLDVVNRILGNHVQPAIAPAHIIESAINRAYESQSGKAQQFISNLDHDQVLSEVQKLSGREDLLDVSSREPVIQLVNLVLFEAYKQQASDIHLQPYETSFVARMRIDGILHDCFHLPKNVQEAIISRVKVMGKMNIAEKRLPQDGRASVQVGDREIDMRIASLPSNYGERVVIRLLDKSARLYTLGEIGMNEHTIDRFRKLVSIEHGIVLVTGPTGSGKTTTLYGTLDEINDNRRNIITLEDPIEYQLPGVSQTQINEKKGLTFASGLRNVLRQDPDIIMVGEIRDHETAVMAIQSALTGHLVFSTLHTNNAASAVTRLLDLGIEPYLVGSSVVGVMAQRLVRKVCPKCVQKIAGTPAQIQSLQLTRGDVPNSLQLSQITGCEHCRQTGYRGRIGLFELLEVNEAIRQDITQRATAARINQTAVRYGMQTLRDDGVQKIINGLTTVEEVDRVTVRLKETEQFVDETV